MRHTFELDENLGRTLRHALAGTQVERHPGPTPIVDMRLQRDERFGRRGMAQFVDIARHRLAVRRAGGILAGDDAIADVVRPDPPQRAQHLDLLVANRGRVEVGRRLHRDQRDQLQHVVLDHVAQRARPVVIIAAPFQPHGLGDGDLDMVDMRRIPQRFEQRIGKAQRQQILDGFLAQIMVDPIGPRFGKGDRHRVVDLAARGEVGAERLLQRKAHTRAGQPGPFQPVDRRLEQRRRGRQEDRQPGSRIDPLAQRRKPRRLGGVERNIGQHPGKRRRLRRIQILGLDMLRERRERTRPIRRIVERAARGTDDLESRWQQSVGIKAVERRQQHAMGKVAGRAEQQQGRDRVSSHGMRL